MIEHLILWQLPDYVRDQYLTVLLASAEHTHRRLVRYYSRFGFVPAASVTGGSLKDLPHLLVWGGVGTRMNADVEEMLHRWSPAIRTRRET